MSKSLFKTGPTVLRFFLADVGLPLIALVETGDITGDDVLLDIVEEKLLPELVVLGTPLVRLLGAGRF